MSFPPNDINSGNYGPPPSNYEEAATLIPSIYSGQKKHITSTEWRDKALDWVKVKQTNETMWNTFGISPAPKVGVLPVVPQISQYITETTKIQQMQQLPEIKKVENILPPFSEPLTKEAPHKRKLVPNWIKSMNITKNTKVKELQEEIKSEPIIEEIKEEIKEEIEIKTEIEIDLKYEEEMKQKLYQDKLKNISQEFTSMIILQITTKIIDKYAKRAFELINDKNNLHISNRTGDNLEPRKRTRKNIKSQTKKSKHSRNYSVSNEKEQDSKYKKSRSKSNSKKKSRNSSNESYSSNLSTNSIDSSSI